MGNKPSLPISSTKEKTPDDFGVTIETMEEAVSYYKDPNKSLIGTNEMYNGNFTEPDKLVNLNNKSINFMSNIYNKAKTVITKNKQKLSSFKNSVKNYEFRTEFNVHEFEKFFEGISEISDEHVSLTLGIISVTTTAIAPPIGLLIAASSILILKTLNTIRSNHELFDIMNDLLNLLNVITDMFNITETKNNEDASHILILKKHIVNIFALVSSINGIYHWRRFVIYPNALIDSFIKEITLINTALIVDLKIDIKNLIKEKNNLKEEGIKQDDEKIIKDYEKEKVDNILDTVIDDKINPSNSDELNNSVSNLVLTTNEIAKNPQTRSEYLNFLKDQNSIETQTTQPQKTERPIMSSSNSNNPTGGTQMLSLNANKNYESIKKRVYKYKKLKKTKMLKCKNKSTKKIKNKK